MEDLCPVLPEAPDCELMNLKNFAGFSCGYSERSPGGWQVKPGHSAGRSGAKRGCWQRAGSPIPGL